MSGITRTLCGREFCWLSSTWRRCRHHGKRKKAVLQLITWYNVVISQVRTDSRLRAHSEPMRQQVVKFMIIHQLTLSMHQEKVKRLPPRPPRHPRPQVSIGGRTSLLTKVEALRQGYQNSNFLFKFNLLYKEL
jgi:hypothetical protein